MVTAVEMRGCLAPGTRARYALAGRATVTIVSAKSGQRFTYEIRKREIRENQFVHFVSVLNGPDNNSHYLYIGMIGERGFSLTPKSKVSKDAPSFIAFDWISKNWESDRMEVWHEGSCGVCGRKLTVPESIATGIGPVCAGR